MPVIIKKPISKKVYRIIENLPRCTSCRQLVLPIVDKSKGSRSVEWKGSSWTESSPTFMPFYPYGEFPELCSYCNYVLNPPIVGKES